MPVVIIGALVIGLTLGLMGSGGSILTVPVLVYLLGHDGKVAIAESLAIVGGIALATMFPYAHSGLVNWRNVIFFGIPGMAGTYVGAWLSYFVSGSVQLTLFAVVMLMAAAIMFRKVKRGTTNLPAEDAHSGSRSHVADPPLPQAPPPQAFWIIGLEGVIVGILTGLVGVGGGFLIVPALVVFGKLPMRMAVGTSLAVIAMKSFSGFYKYLDILESTGASIDWATVGTFVLIGIVGSFAGHAVATRVNQVVLRRVFAVFLIGMGLFVLGKEGRKLIDHQGSAPAKFPNVETHLDARRNDLYFFIELGC
jgi:uncharacterized membrane protein YfcA